MIRTFTWTAASGGGYDPMTAAQLMAAMNVYDLAVVSLLADMGNGEGRFVEKDLPRVNGRDLSGSNAQHLLH